MYFGSLGSSHHITVATRTRFASGTNGGGASSDSDQSGGTKTSTTTGNGQLDTQGSVEIRTVLQTVLKDVTNLTKGKK
jgi:hypothetical protein